ncbi:MAG: cytochrome c family protein [Vicinamibacterales bacterium]
MRRVLDAGFICTAVVAGVALVCLGTTVSAQEAERGAAVFAEQKCGICHSIGDAGNKRGPLDAVGATLTPEDIRQWLLDPAAMASQRGATRKPPMRAYANLPQGDIEALVAYLRTLRR